MLGVQRRRKIIGIALIVVGILFLMVANNVLLGWENVWPLFAVFAGILFFKVYAAKKTPDMLFGGITAFCLGVLFFFFSMGALPWSEMGSLWPFIPLIAGVALLAVAVTQRHGTGSLLSGVGLLLFAALGFLHNTGFIDERVASPFVRFWPVVLIVAGIILIKARHNEEVPDVPAAAVREAASDPPVPAEAASPEAAEITPKNPEE